MLFRVFISALSLAFLFSTGLFSTGLSAVGLSAVGPSNTAGEPTLPTVDPTFEVEVSTALVYGTGEVEAPEPGQMDLVLDLYEPIGAKSQGELMPALVIVHGGGFVGGSRQQPELVEIANRMASRGYVVISIDYRLARDEPVSAARVDALLQLVIDAQDGAPADDSVAMVAAVDDGLTALDWLRASAASLGVDPGRIGLLGASAGAITSIHLAYVLNNYGIQAQDLSFVVDLWGGSYLPPGEPETAANHLETGEPPLFAIHGLLDTSVLPVLSELLIARALDQGVMHEYHPLADAGHGFGTTDIFNREVSPGVTLFDRVLIWTRAVLTGTVPPALPLFTDDFESGDTSSWSEVLIDPT